MKKTAKKIQNAEKESLSKELNSLRDRIDAVERVEIIMENTKLIGQCYKFLNSYGSDSKDWWMYKKVISAKGDCLKTIQFQNDESGRLEIVIDRWHDSRSFGEHYIKISQSEFDVAKRTFLAKVEYAMKCTATE